MRKFLFDSHLKLAVVSGVYTVLLLLVLPRIPININKGVIKINSYVGGYRFNIMGRDFDFSEFSKSIELGGGYKLILKVPVSEEESMRKIVSRRLGYLKINRYKIETEYEDDNAVFYLYIPLVKNIDYVQGFIQSRSFLIFRELPEDVEFSEENSSEFFYDITNWVDTGLDSTNIINAVVLPNSQGSAATQFQINLTPEGQEIFSEVVTRNVGRPVAIYMDKSPYPISMPLVGEDLINAGLINPVVTSNADPESTKLFVDSVNTGFYPTGYEFVSREEFEPVYEGFSTRVFVLAFVLGFFLSSMFMFFTYRKFSLAFLLSLLIQLISSLFFLKVNSVFIGVDTILILFLSIVLYVAFGGLLLSQMKEHLEDKSMISIHMNEAFRSSVKIMKPYLLVFFISTLVFQFTQGIWKSSLFMEMIIGYVSCYIAFLTFKLFAKVFWIKKVK